MLWRVTVVLVVVGVWVTADSVWVVVVVIGAGSSTAVQEVRARRASAGSTISNVFISCFMLTKLHSAEVALADGLRSNFLGPRDRHFATRAAREINRIQHFHEVNRRLRVILRRHPPGDCINEVLHLEHEGIGIILNLQRLVDKKCEWFETDRRPESRKLCSCLILVRNRDPAEFHPSGYRPRKFLVGTTASLRKRNLRHR